VVTPDWVGETAIGSSLYPGKARFILSQYVQFLREICPQEKYTPKIGANIGAITGILLNLNILRAGNILQLCTYSGEPDSIPN
jgi:hypothetical protein